MHDRAQSSLGSILGRTFGRTVRLRQGARTAWTVAAALGTAVWLTGCGALVKTAHAPTVDEQTLQQQAGQTAQGGPAGQHTGLMADPKYGGPVVATYRGGTLTKQELDQQYNLLVVFPHVQPRPSKAEFLKQYVVLYKYVYAQAVKSGAAKPDPAQAASSADSFLQQVAQQDGKSEAQEQQRLADLGLHRDDLVRLFEKQQVVTAYLNQLVAKSPLPDEIAKQYYDAHKAECVRVTVQHILVKDLALAKKIVAQLRAGASFDQLADKYSVDTGAKDTHGKYVDAFVPTFVPNFAKACLTLPIGQVSDPVHTQYGYHVMRVLARKPLDFAEAKQDILNLPDVQAEVQQKVGQSVYNQVVHAADVKVVPGAKL
ncbi:hypothetical protein GCM10010885_17480 [Alicyclobacillus cellulosilyticus]|uniref:PpiC domain-containing protein n=1 Tax=Alicyclobacillus cellulosilyticus TaxID=1003997 RepID=A0A917KD13_9BACL|nr:peptidylprolyl isomerase [Alicyclobacillus cellulosilyticus]GGJ08881.1 hypothetical protein GCM10010885_17480 [Alicyclobacillus cellulosilyticus]